MECFATLHLSKCREGSQDHVPGKDWNWVIVPLPTTSKTFSWQVLVESLAPTKRAPPRCRYTGRKRGQHGHNHLGQWDSIAAIAKLSTTPIFFTFGPLESIHHTGLRLLRWVYGWALRKDIHFLQQNLHNVPGDESVIAKLPRSRR